MFAQVYGWLCTRVYTSGMSFSKQLLFLRSLRCFSRALPALNSAHAFLLSDALRFTVVIQL